VSKIIIFYHTCQLPAWDEIFYEQINTVKDSGLMDAADEFRIHINGDFIPDPVSENCIYFHNPNPEQEESDTMRAIRDYCFENPDDKIMYFHTKGIKYQVEPVWPAASTEYVVNWRRMMEHYVIKQWDVCVKLLKHYDTVGCNYAVIPRQHWSGGMWWANAGFINRLDHSLLDTPNRFDREFWIGSSDGTFAGLHSSGVDHYNVNYPQELWTPIPQELMEKIND
jgi:hypothetical protein